MTLETFTVQLSSAATVAALEEWLGCAPARGRAVYANGLDLPHGAPAVLLVQGWQQQGLVHLFRQRDPADPRRWQFLVERAGSGMPGAVVDLGQGGGSSCCPGHLGAPTAALHEARVGGVADDPQRAALLAVLRASGAECPSNRNLARQLGLGHGQRGRNRVQYLLTVLERTRAIELTNNGRNAPRGLRVLSTGENQ